MPRKHKKKSASVGTSDVRSRNPGASSGEGRGSYYPPKSGYQIPYDDDTNRSPYKPGFRGYGDAAKARRLRRRRPIPWYAKQNERS